MEPLSSRPDVPPLAICLMCTGTRGDVQPFIVSPQLEAFGAKYPGSQQIAQLQHQIQCVSNTNWTSTRGMQGAGTS